MLWTFKSHSRPSRREHRREGWWVSASLTPAYLVPGLIVGFLFGYFLDLRKPPKSNTQGNNKNLRLPTSAEHKKLRETPKLESYGTNQELKMVFIVRQDLKMGVGKIASQCAHAATGAYAELSLSRRSLLRQWESFGQPKIVVSCKNQQEMNRLKEAAESIGLPTFVVADAGRTQVLAGSRTVLAVGPGDKSLVDSVTGKLRLL